MDDNDITAIVGWPTEPQMVKFRAVAAAAEAAERDCRTCAHYLPHHRAGVMHCTSPIRCVAGGRYCKAGRVQQWEGSPEVGVF